MDANGKKQRMEGDFVLGCDGGGSVVRKGLFGKSFPGYTWPMQLVAVNVWRPVPSRSLKLIELQDTLRR